MYCNRFKDLKATKASTHFNPNSQDTKIAWPSDFVVLGVYVLMLVYTISLCFGCWTMLNCWNQETALKTGIQDPLP